MTRIQNDNFSSSRSGSSPCSRKSALPSSLFTVVRQLEYSARDAGHPHRQSLDVALFLNGLPLFTAELKNPLTGQSYPDAVRQHQFTRSDPQEPLFAFGRCLAHFAVDPDEVWFATHLQGPATEFFPLNQGRGTGAGNPLSPPSSGRFATAYLWEQVWARDSVLDLVEHFVHEIEVEDDGGRGQWPTEILQQIELETYVLQHAHNGQIELERGSGRLEPQGVAEEHRPEAEETVALSGIVQLLNERFGAHIPAREGERFVALLQQRLLEDEGLAASVRANPREKARLTFDHLVNDRIQDLVDVSFRFYKLLNDDPAFAAVFQDLMFNRYLQMSQAQPEAQV